MAARKRADVVEELAYSELWTNGKGDRPRPLTVPKETFDKNWDKTFGRDKDQCYACLVRVDTLVEVDGECFCVVCNGIIEAAEVVKLEAN